MEVKLKSLQITDYNDKDTLKIKFIKSILEDEDVKKNINADLNNAFEKTKNINKLAVGPAYLVKDDKQLVGFIKMDRSSDETLNLTYGVDREYRHKGYGSKILVEMSDYLLRNLYQTNSLRLEIKPSNHDAAKCAENAKFIVNGFVRYPESGSTMIYSKTR